MISIAIVDTGPLVAAANRADPDHGPCLEALQSGEYSLVIPSLCVAEATYLIGRGQGPRIEALFLRSLESFDVQAPVGEEWLRIGELVEAYLWAARTPQSSPWPRGSRRTSSSRWTEGTFPRSGLATPTSSACFPEVAHREDGDAAFRAAADPRWWLRCSAPVPSSHP